MTDRAYYANAQIHLFEDMPFSLWNDGWQEVFEFWLECGIRPSNEQLDFQLSAEEVKDFADPCSLVETPAYGYLFVDRDGSLEIDDGIDFEEDEP